MELTVLERLLLLRVLPKQGNLTMLRIVRDLERDLSFSEEEHAALQFDTKGGAIKWQPGAVPDKDVRFGPRAMQLVVDALTEMDKKAELTLDWLDLCDKFGYVGQDDAEK